MSVLEQILQEIEKEKSGIIGCGPMPPQIAFYAFKDEGLDLAIEIIKKHLSANDTNVLSDDKWIPVNPDTLPDHKVLVCDKYEEYLIGYMSCTKDDDGEIQYVCESDECIMYDPIAWQPLPESYRLKED